MKRGVSERCCIKALECDPTVVAERMIQVLVQERVITKLRDADKIWQIRRTRFVFSTGLACLTLFNANKTCLRHTKPAPKMVAPAATRRVFGNACDASDRDHS